MKPCWILFVVSAVCWWCLSVRVTGEDRWNFVDTVAEVPLREARELVNHNAAELAAMPLDDPRLRVAYFQMIVAYRPYPRFKFEHGSPEALSFSLADLKRRGAAAVPLLLDMMEKNANFELEMKTAWVAMGQPEIPYEPFLEYQRKLVRERGDDLSSLGMSYLVGSFFSRGTPDDLKALEALAEKRPFLKDAYENKLKNCIQLKELMDARAKESRQGSESEPSNETTAFPTLPHPVPAADTHAPPSNERIQTNMAAISWIAAGVCLILLVWKLSRRLLRK